MVPPLSTEDLSGVISDSSEAKYTAMFAICMGIPKPKRCCSEIFAISGDSGQVFLRDQRGLPKAIAFTRILFGAYSCMTLSLRPPHLCRRVASLPGKAIIATFDDILITEPPPASTIAGYHALSKQMCQKI